MQQHIAAKNLKIFPQNISIVHKGDSFSLFTLLCLLLNDLLTKKFFINVPLSFLAKIYYSTFLLVYISLIGRFGRLIIIRNLWTPMNVFNSLVGVPL